MVADDVLMAYEKIIQTRFPTVIAVDDPRYADGCGDTVGALGVPEGRRKEFARFIMEELAPAIEARGVEQLAVMPYSPAEAEEYFPDACRAVLA